MERGGWDELYCLNLRDMKGQDNPHPNLCIPSWLREVATDRGGEINRGGGGEGGAWPPEKQGSAFLFSWACQSIWWDILALKRKTRYLDILYAVS